MDSFLRYFGGKSRLTDKLLTLIPEHKCYCEVFCGASWLLFRKQISKVEIINDINKDLIILYEVIRNNFVEFVERFEWTLTSRDYYNELKKLNPKELNKIDRAFRFYYLNRYAFGGRNQHTMATSHQRKANIRPEKIKSKLQKHHKRLSGVWIENLHFSDIIDKYDNEDTFFYIDPPYWNNESSYGKDIFFKEDFEKLRDILEKIKGKFLLSINDVPEIREIYKDFLIKEIYLQYSVHSNAMINVKELIIINYTPERIELF